MAEEDFEEEVQYYRQAILDIVAHINPYFFWEEDAPEIGTRFKALAQNQYALFRRVCLKLLEDDNLVVRLNILRMMESVKIKDAMLEKFLAHLAVEQRDLTENALDALWPRRTRSVLPQLFLLAERGYWNALDQLRGLLQTPEEIERGVAIARKYIEAKEYYLREAALFLLLRYSTMNLEAEGVLAAVQKYLDELFIDALKKAPAEKVLASLKAIQASIREGAEYEDLESTIRVLEQKTSEKCE